MGFPARALRPPPSCWGVAWLQPPCLCPRQLSSVGVPAHPVPTASLAPPRVLVGAQTWGGRREANREQRPSTLTPEVRAGSAVPSWGPPGPCELGDLGHTWCSGGRLGEEPPRHRSPTGVPGWPRGGSAGSVPQEGLCRGQGQGRTALPPRGGEAPASGPPRELSAGKGCPQGLASVLGDLQDSPLVSSQGGGSAAEGGTQRGVWDGEALLSPAVPTRWRHWAAQEPEPGLAPEVSNDCSRHPELGRRAGPQDPGTKAHPSQPHQCSSEADPDWGQPGRDVTGGGWGREETTEQ